MLASLVAEGVGVESDEIRIPADNAVAVGYPFAVGGGSLNRRW